MCFFLELVYYHKKPDCTCTVGKKSKECPPPSAPGTHVNRITIEIHSGITDLEGRITPGQLYTLWECGWQNKVMTRFSHCQSNVIHPCPCQSFRVIRSQVIPSQLISTCTWPESAGRFKDYPIGMDITRCWPLQFGKSWRSTLWSFTCLLCSYVSVCSAEGTGLNPW